jgi:hypothetical protein
MRSSINCGGTEICVDIGQTPQDITAGKDPQEDPQNLISSQPPSGRRLGLGNRQITPR